MATVLLSISTYFVMCILCSSLRLSDAQRGLTVTTTTSDDISSLSNRLGIVETIVRKTVLSMNDVDLRVQRDFKNMSDEHAMEKAIQADTLKKYVNLQRQYSDLQGKYSVLLKNNSNLGIQLSNLETQLSNQQSNFGTQLTNLGTQLSNLQKKYTELKTAMDVSSKMVAFTVKLNGSYQSPRSIITPSVVLTNIGGGYNKTSGIFTCRVKGLYSFSVHLISNSGNKGIYIYKNDQPMTLAYSVNGNWDGGSASLVTYLDVGNTITVKTHGSNLSLDPGSNFSGMKIH